MSIPAGEQNQLPNQEGGDCDLRPLTMKSNTQVCGRLCADIKLHFRHHGNITDSLMGFVLARNLTQNILKGQ
jgi:hypothetical protein